MLRLHTDQTLHKYIWNYFYNNCVAFDHLLTENGIRSNKTWSCLSVHREGEEGKKREKKQTYEYISQTQARTTLLNYRKCAGFYFLRKSALFLPLFMAFAQGLKAHGKKTATKSTGQCFKVPDLSRVLINLTELNWTIMCTQCTELLLTAEVFRHQPSERH